MGVRDPWHRTRDVKLRQECGESATKLYQIAVNVLRSDTDPRITIDFDAVVGEASSIFATVMPREEVKPWRGKAGEERAVNWPAIAKERPKIWVAASKSNKRFRGAAAEV